MAVSETHPSSGGKLTFFSSAVAHAANAARRAPARPANRLVVSYVADHIRRYPGEEAHLYCRVQVREPLEAISLEVAIPAGVEFRTVNCLRGINEGDVNLRRVADHAYLVWTLQEAIGADRTFEWEIVTKIKPTNQDRTLESRAVCTARSADQGDIITDEESLAIAVAARGSYTRYLPAIYLRDHFMGRLLMLFESFWAPIDNQISHIDSYFDPSVAPPDFLTWLASWLDLTLDEGWPEARRRDLLKSARRLYAKRGTRVGLQEYLEIYTGGEVQIVEHKAQNAHIGRQFVLGTGNALGRDNYPHTFTVNLRLPADADSPEAIRDEAYWQRVVRKIIEHEKPAHTSYTLHIEYPNLEEASTHERQSSAS